MLGNLIDSERLIHSLKTAIACVFGFFLTRVVGFTADQWIVITIIVVMCAQLYVGSVIQKAYLRFLGTLGGCLFAITTISFFGDGNLAIAATLALSSFVFSYLATGQESMSYTGTLGAVTTAIIMLGQKPTVIFATERFLEISVGILIATLISQFILPIHARTHLRRSQAATLGQLRDYYTETIITPRNGNMTMDEHDLDENIVKSLLKQRLLAKESKNEPLGVSFDANHFMQSLYCEREMLRTITFMHQAISHIRDTQAEFIQSSAMHKFNDAVILAISTIINVISTNRNSGDNKEHIHTPSLDALKSELQHSTATFSQDDLTHSYGFLFSADILIDSLVKLAGIYRIPVYSGEPGNPSP